MICKQKSISLKTSLLCMLVLLALVSFAQKPIDSLKRMLLTQKEDTNKVKTYFEVVKILRRYDYEAAKDFANKQLLLSKKLHFLWGIGKAYNGLGLIARPLRDFAGSCNNFQNAAQVFLIAKDYDNLITAYTNISENYAEMYKPDSTIFYNKLAYKYNELITDPMEKLDNKMSIYSSTANAFLNSQVPDSALIYTDSCIQIAKILNNKSEMADNYSVAASAYQLILQHKTALQYLRMALQLYEETNYLHQRLTVLASMGEIFYSLKNYDSTIFYTQKSIILGQQSGDSGLLPRNYLNMGLAKTGLHQYNEALGWYKKALITAASIHDNNTEVQLYQFIGEILYKMKNYNEAIISCKKALSITDKSNYYTVKDCTNTISLCYEEMGDYKNALLYERQSRNAENLFFDTTKAKIISQLSVKYEMERKETALKLLSSQNELQILLAKENSERTSIAYMGIGLVVLSGCYGFYRFRKRKGQQSKEALTSERLRISQELHDEVGATLSGISMYSHLAKEQMQLAQNTEVSKSLHIMQQSAGEMVNKLNDIVWLINPMQDTLQKLIQRLEEYATDMAAIKNMKVKIIVPDKFSIKNLPVESRRNIYLFCKEAINNVVKYSGADLLEIGVKETNYHLEIAISDNGKGFNMDTIKRGNGLNNMKQRADNLAAEYTIQSKVGAGCSILLKVKMT